MKNQSKGQIKTSGLNNIDRERTPAAIGFITSR